MVKPAAKNENLPEVQARPTETIAISGKVTAAEDGLSLPGVNVYIRGTTVGTTTGIEGEYQIDVPKETTHLVFPLLV